MKISVGFNEELAAAVRARNAGRLSRLVDAGRRAGATYRDLFERASAATGIDESEWDALMEEADDLDAGVER